MGSDANNELIEKGKKPFFNWISADNEIATARGGGTRYLLYANTFTILNIPFIIINCIPLLKVEVWLFGEESLKRKIKIHNKKHHTQSFYC